MDMRYAFGFDSRPATGLAIAANQERGKTIMLNATDQELADLWAAFCASHPIKDSE